MREKKRNYYRNGSLKTTDASETCAVKRSLTVAGGDIFCSASAAEKSTNDWIIKINRRVRTFLWNRDGNYYFCFAQNSLLRSAVTSCHNIAVRVTSVRGVRSVQGLYINSNETGAPSSHGGRPRGETTTEKWGENSCGSSSKIVWNPGIDK